MEEESILDDKNKIVMKLLHYFITEKNYNPIILQGVENEIWLENLSEDYKVVRIVSGHIHNDEQYDFDKFKKQALFLAYFGNDLGFKVKEVYNVIYKYFSNKDFSLFVIYHIISLLFTNKYYVIDF